jgi:hypothetical protein
MAFVSRLSCPHHILMFHAVLNHGTLELPKSPALDFPQFFCSFSWLFHTLKTIEAAPTHRIGGWEQKSQQTHIFDGKNM